jgi:hypothetical protein
MRMSWLSGLAGGAALSIVGGGAALAADLTGTWTVSGTIVADGQIVASATPVCTFQQAGSQLSGTCKGPNAVGPAVGTVEGADVAWQWAASADTREGTSNLVRFRGTMGADGVIRGAVTFSAVPGRSGAFTQQRQ